MTLTLPPVRYRRSSKRVAHSSTENGRTRSMDCATPTRRAGSKGSISNAGRTRNSAWVAWRTRSPLWSVRSPPTPRWVTGVARPVRRSRWRRSSSNRARSRLRKAYTGAPAAFSREQESREHGTLEWLAARFACGEGDFKEALRRSARAGAIGKRLRDADVEVMALLYQGVATLALGDPTRGIALQDEAAAAALAGEVSPLTGSLIYCGVIAGCRNHGDWERAAHWVEHFTRWCERSGLSVFPGTCRLYQGEVLSVRGRLAEAEKEINQACTELPMGAPWAAGDAYRVLGEIRLARSDLEGAEMAFRRAHELGWDPQPGYALLQVARGRVDTAVRGLERALEDQRWSNRQRRGLLLAYLVIVAQAAGQTDRARKALKELDEHPELWSTPSLVATVERARAETALSEGRYADAIGSLRRGAQRWQEIGSPLNVASYRLRLAELLCGEGDYEAAELELSAASSIFRQVGVTARLQSCEELRRSLSRTVD
jgi:tetratricopeptide (TPR) repeat protein